MWTAVFQEMNIKAIFAELNTSSKNEAWKNSGLYGIWTHDLCDAVCSALLTELTNQLEAGFKSRTGQNFFQAALLT